jgi:tRNA uridine 5-carboxymethylaminomethyl modification enzyme
MSEADRELFSAAPAAVIEQLVIQARYDGYIRRQLAEIRRHRATETLAIPPGFDFWPLEGLTYEAKDKLSRLRPVTLGQASRIPGVSPADISVLLVHLYRSLKSGSDTQGEVDTIEDADVLSRGR